MLKTILLVLEGIKEKEHYLLGIFGKWTIVATDTVTN